MFKLKTSACTVRTLMVLEQYCTGHCCGCGNRNLFAKQSKCELKPSRQAARIQALGIRHSIVHPSSHTPSLYKHTRFKQRLPWSSDIDVRFSLNKILCILWIHRIHPQEFFFPDMTILEFHVTCYFYLFLCLASRGLFLCDNNGPGLLSINVVFQQWLDTTGVHDSNAKSTYNYRRRGYMGHFWPEYPLDNFQGD